MKIINRKIMGGIFILGVWYFVSLILNSPVLPNPKAVILQLFSNQGMILLQHLSVSLMRIFICLLISSILGLLLGYSMAKSKTVDALLSPIIYFLMPIPKVAFLPIFMLMFGLGEMPKIILIVSVIIFQFIVGTYASIQNIEPGLVKSMQSLNLSKQAEFKHLILPSILPSLLTSVRVSFGISFSVLFFAETFSTKFGIGYYIMNSWAMANNLNMYAGILVLSLIGVFTYEILDLIERRLLIWKQ